MTIEYFILMAVIVLAAYFIRGITGFGSGLLAIPLLALFLPLTFVVPLILLMDFTASLVMGSFDLKKVQWGEVLALIPFSIIGVVVGTQLLLNVPEMPLLIALALFIFIFAVRSLLNKQGNTLISKRWAIPAAFTGGTIGGLFGTGGPPYVIYLSHRIHDKTLLRATFSALFFLEGAMRILSFFTVGLLLSYSIWWNALELLPIMLLGLYLGSHVHTGLSQMQMTRLVGILLLLSSVSLLFKAFV